VTLHALAARVRRMVRREGRPSAGSPGVVVHRVDQAPEEVEQYWTDERMRSARPRQIVAPDPQAPDPQASTGSPDADLP
jgi:hypothetical protein